MTVKLSGAALGALNAMRTLADCNRTGDYLEITTVFCCNRKMKSLLPVLCSFSLFVAGHSFAGKAMWNENPISNDWDDPANWTPEIVPHGSSNTAIFGQSQVTDIMLGTNGAGPHNAETFLDGIQFNAGPQSYTITIAEPDIRYSDIVSLEGTGIVSYRPATQNFIIGSPAARALAELLFKNFTAVTGNIVLTTMGAHKGSSPAGGGLIDFDDFSSAENAQIINEGATVNGGPGGVTFFSIRGGAQNALIINNPGTVRGAKGGNTIFVSDYGGDMNQSTVINNGASVAGALGGTTDIEGFGFSEGATYVAGGAAVVGGGAGYVFVQGGIGFANFTAAGGTSSGAAGGLVEIRNYLRTYYTEATVITAEGGTNGGLGGTVLLDSTISQPLSQFQILGNGLLDLSGVDHPQAMIGSLSGDGMVDLAGHQLVVGNNNMTTAFSGVIEDEGRVLKSGTGTLTLSGASTYKGSTSVVAGTLVVANVTGSATGEGGVRVAGGTLGGSGIITGPVMVGESGGSSPGILAPAAGASTPAALTVQNTLTFNSPASYDCLLATIGNTTSADQLIVNGVTIVSGAQFNLLAQVQGNLDAGTSFTVINNSSASPISGTFSNLPDGGTVSAGNNTLQANYEGGDGNDLTLTVVP